MNLERHHYSDQEPARPPEQPTLSVAPVPPDSAGEPLRCLWSGYPNYDRTCRSRIPVSVVVKAWRRDAHLKGTVEGFFNFSWRSGVWLAYGLPDGKVRGVYCPTHCSERDAREENPPGEPTLR
jgi:hypothetical protein